MEDICCKILRAEACVDMSARHTSERGRKGDCVKVGGGEEGECEVERALGVRPVVRHSRGC